MVMLETLKRYIGEGWAEAGLTLTYASADSSANTNTVYSGTVTATGDYTSNFSVGMKFKFTQTTVKYFVLVKIEYSAPSTTFTFYGGTDYQVADATITDVYYSSVKAPLGFPMDRDKWDIYYSRESATTTASPTQNVWYNNGGSLIVPVGLWGLSYRVFSQLTLASTTIAQMLVTLSTANNSESNDEMTTWGLSMYPVNPNTMYGVLNIIPETVSTATETTYYLNGLARAASTSNLTMGSTIIPLLIRGQFLYV